MQAVSADVDSLALLIREDEGIRSRELPCILALHERGGDAAGAIAAARATFGDNAAIVAPQAARPCNPLQSNGGLAARYGGYSWYLSEDLSRPEPASFGDALSQLELLLNECEDRRLVLFGSGQGAVLALTLATYGFDSVAGVAFGSGALPCMLGWSLPAASLRGKQFLTLDDAMPASIAAAIEERGGSVQTLASVRAAAWLENLSVRDVARREAQ